MRACLGVGVGALLPAYGLSQLAAWQGDSSSPSPRRGTGAGQAAAGRGQGPCGRRSPGAGGGARGGARRGGSLDWLPQGQGGGRGGDTQLAGGGQGEEGGVRGDISTGNRKEHVSFTSSTVSDDDHNDRR